MNIKERLLELATRYAERGSVEIAEAVREEVIHSLERIAISPHARIFHEMTLLAIPGFEAVDASTVAVNKKAAVLERNWSELSNSDLALLLLDPGALRSLGESVEFEWPCAWEPVFEYN